MFEQQLIESIGRSNAELMRMVIEPAATRRAELERELERLHEEAAASPAHRPEYPGGWLGRIGARLHVHRRQISARQSHSPR